MRHPAGAGVWLLRAAAVVASALFLIAVHAAFGGSSTALAAEKGLLDPRLAWSVAGSPERKALVRELSGGLGTNWVRLNVYWNKLEPTRGTYDPREVGRLDSLVDDLRAVGVKVILTTCAMPVWAQEQRWWSHPPPGFAKGPQGCYPLRRDALPAYRALGGFLATHFKGRVRYLECWNEPNLWVGICPQRTAADPWFAARRYLQMLRAFSLGVRCARTGALVVAGAGAPNGRNDVLSTSPRDLALFLQRHGAARYFDVYSHHPYTPGGTVRTGPTDTPNDGSATVVISNLDVLLRVFPDKPFFLTEYGYNTRPSMYYGYFAVSPRLQAAYLRSAFSHLRRYPRVRVLIWYLLQDTPGDSAGTGIYTGLRDAGGSRKPSWYAFRNVR